LLQRLCNLFVSSMSDNSRTFACGNQPGSKSVFCTLFFNHQLIVCHQ